VRFTGKQPPWNLRALFENVPGFIIQKIIWDGSSWSMDAVIYEKKGG
jgi:hypothetical protein